ncbi:MAG: carbohydrate kinase family protein [Chlorobi bacterium]|nr:carbohydrate kinase family protein [Chlorobiota bacterium]
MNKYDIITAFDLCVDFLVDLGKVEPEFGQKEQWVDGYTLELGGSAVIFASQIAKLGLKTAGIGKVGDDLFGRFIFDRFNEIGICKDYISIDKTIKTGVGVALCKPNDRAILTYNGSIDEAGESDFSNEVIKNTRHIHISSYYLMQKLQPGYPGIIKKAKKSGVTISLDTNWDPDENWDSGIMDLLPFVDIFLPNRNELLWISKEGTYQKAVEKLSAIVPMLVVKNGEHGADAYVKGAFYHAGALSVKLADTVGAGDNFDAGFVFGYLSGYDIKTCLEIGIACGSLSATQYGGIEGQPRLDEVKHYLKGLEIQ